MTQTISSIKHTLPSFLNVRGDLSYNLTVGISALSVGLNIASLVAINFVNPSSVAFKHLVTTSLAVGTTTAAIGIGLAFKEVSKCCKKWRPIPMVIHECRNLYTPQPPFQISFELFEERVCDLIEKYKNNQVPVNNRDLNAFRKIIEANSHHVNQAMQLDAPRTVFHHLAICGGPLEL